MTTHLLTTIDPYGNHQRTLLGEVATRDLITQYLAQPPVQFIRLPDDEGWEVECRGHASLLLKLKKAELH